MTQQGMLWPNHDISGRNVALANQLRACNVCIQRVPWYVVVRPGYTLLSRLPNKKCRYILGQNGEALYLTQQLTLRKNTTLNPVKKSNGLGL